LRRISKTAALQRNRHSVFDDLRLVLGGRFERDAKEMLPTGNVQEIESLGV
jgi:hypothetical protein